LGGAEPPLPGLARALVGDGTVTDRTYARACVRMARDAAEALEHAHRRGVIHGDVKPANLILDDRGHVFVADFGLASFRTEGIGPTVSGDLVGTLRYMSPEQARAQHAAVDHRTDVYSLGVTLYELLSLERAFPGESVPDLIEAITKRSPPPLRQRSRHVPATLEAIVETAKAKVPDNRYATAGDLARDLERFLAGRSATARAPGPGKRLRRRIARHPWATVVVLGMVLAGAFALVVIPK
jgi:serine/threonine protein kinase